MALRLWLAGVVFLGLAHAGDPQGRVSAAIEALKAPAAMDRRAAAVILSLLEDREKKPAIPHLIRALADPDPEVRDQVAMALFGDGSSAMMAMLEIGEERRKPSIRLKFPHYRTDEPIYAKFLKLLQDSEIGQALLKSLKDILTVPVEESLREELRRTHSGRRGCARFLVKRIPSDKALADRLLKDPFPKPEPEPTIKAVGMFRKDLALLERGDPRAELRIRMYGPAAIPALKQAQEDATTVMRARIRSLLQEPYRFVADPKKGTPRDGKTQLPKVIVSRKAAVELVLIPSGSFMFGISPNDPLVNKENWADEIAARKAAVRKPFFLGRYEVTNAQWLSVMKAKPSRASGGPNEPVVGVSWNDIQKFLRRTGFRLPTEIEWEFACRAGTTGPTYGDTSKPNGYGLHRMIGGVWEWCSDAAGEVPAKHRVFLVAPGLPAPQSRILRGGGRQNQPYWLRASVRPSQVPSYRNTDLGFRVALDAR